MLATLKFCSHCKKDYHDQSECNDLHPERRKQDNRTSQGSNDSTRRNVRGRGRQGGRGGRGGRGGGSESTSKDQPAGGHAGFAFTLIANSTALHRKSHAKSAATTAEACALSAQTALTCLWIFDSGCTQHMTRDRSVFKDYTPFPGPGRPVGGLNSTCYASGFGTIHLLNNVWYVPQSGYNLISQGQLEDQQCSLRFVPNGIAVGEHGVTFKRHANRLYILNMWQEAPQCLAAINALESSLIDPLLDDEQAQAPAQDSDDSDPEDPTTTASPNQKPKSKSKPINEETLKMRHARLGHIGRQSILKLAKVSSGMDLTAPPPQEPCEPCVVSHTGRIKPGRWQKDLIYSDLQGPFQLTYDGYQYLVTFLDDKTLRSAVLLLRDKSAKSVLDAFRMYANQAEHDDCTITRLRSDCGTEYDNSLMLEYRLSKGITWEPTVPGTPQMNVKSEGLGQTLRKIASAILKDSGLPEKFWGELGLTANYLRNRQPVAGRVTTPYEAATGKPPRLSHLRVVGKKGLCQHLRAPTAT
jgi:hypothetical protein